MAGWLRRMGMLEMMIIVLNGAVITTRIENTDVIVPSLHLNPFSCPSPLKLIPIVLTEPDSALLCVPVVCSEWS